ncbi:hypothetical protein LTR56_005383 [Elasticomyces elasticus]|nr:hypothetical protein LTR22_018656 [Elasticomyces elasticus]KAK3651876.1 hypothetical protein LTR56_005383 [Elasticomyces elasticus]KAK4927771.1 hypothetical protein LTR49_005395 [Elasticomyces elasticus]KAK5761442.1 hypothetical protein LTS12_008403 [Elasticomyces elasticus]
MDWWVRKRNFGKTGKADLSQQTEEFPWPRQIDFDGWYEGSVKLRTILRHGSAALNKTGERKQIEAGDLSWHGQIDFSTASKPSRWRGSLLRPLVDFDDLKRILPKNTMRYPSAEKKDCNKIRKRHLSKHLEVYLDPFKANQPTHAIHDHSG